jgi:hypothetical protein
MTRSANEWAGRTTRVLVLVFNQKRPSRTALTVPSWLLLEPSIGVPSAYPTLVTTALS